MAHFPGLSEQLLSQDNRKALTFSISLTQRVLLGSCLCAGDTGKTYMALPSGMEEFNEKGPNTGNAKKAEPQTPG